MCGWGNECRFIYFSQFYICNVLNTLGFVICLFSVIKIVLCLFICYSEVGAYLVFYTHIIYSRGVFRNWSRGVNSFLSRGEVAQDSLPLGSKNPLKTLEIIDPVRAELLKPPPPWICLRYTGWVKNHDLSVIAKH